MNLSLYLGIYDRFGEDGLDEKAQREQQQRDWGMKTYEEVLKSCQEHYSCQYP